MKRFVTYFIAALLFITSTFISCNFEPPEANCIYVIDNCETKNGRADIKCNFCYRDPSSGTIGNELLSEDIIIPYKSYCVFYVNVDSSQLFRFKYTSSDGSFGGGWETTKNGAETIKYVKMPWPGNSTGTCRTYFMDYLPTLERQLLQQGKTKLDTVYVNCKPKE